MTGCPATEGTSVPTFAIRGREHCGRRSGKNARAEVPWKSGLWIWPSCYIRELSAGILLQSSASHCYWTSDQVFRFYAAFTSGWKIPIISFPYANVLYEFSTNHLAQMSYLNLNSRSAFTMWPQAVYLASPRVSSHLCNEAQWMIQMRMDKIPPSAYLLVLRMIFLLLSVYHIPDGTEKWAEQRPSPLGIL